MPEYIGGAEMATDAIIEKCPFEYIKFRSKDLKIEDIEQNKNDLWIIGNFADIQPALLEKLSEVRHVCIEYDYKLCNFRSPDVHRHQTSKECDCVNEKVIKLYSTADHVFFMSERQMNWSLERVPFMNAVLLSSPFSEDNILAMRDFRNFEKNNPRTEKHIVIFSNSWIKGTKEAVKYCVENNIDYEFLYKIPYIQILTKLSKAIGYVHLPAGGDTCPRSVIEAKLLGCELIINDNVEHKNEAWFATDNIEEIEKYLLGRVNYFWGLINAKIKDPLGNGRT